MLRSNSMKWSMRWFALLWWMAALSGIACSQSKASDNARPTLDLAHRKALIQQARASYYRLKENRVSGFRCRVVPDWDLLYSNLKVDDSGRELLSLLKQVRFRVVVGPTGASNVSHDSDVVPPNEQLAERLRQSISGFEQVVTGFFQTWTAFAIDSPFSENDNKAEIRESDGKYRFSAKQDTVEVLIVTTRDFAVEEMDVTTPQFHGVVRPKFTTTKNGFLLNAYSATLKSGEAVQELSAEISYQDVDGVTLPAKVSAAVTVPTTKLAVGMSVVDYQVDKLPAGN